MLRRVESDLRGHEEGVWGVDEGVENISLPVWKRGRTTWSVCAIFSDFIVVGNQNDGNNHGQKEIHHSTIREYIKSSSFVFEWRCIIQTHFESFELLAFIFLLFSSDEQK